MNPELQRIHVKLAEIWSKLGTGSGTASDVNITGDAVGLNKEATQLQVLTELQRLANIEIDVDTINLNTDQLETLLAQISAKLPATLGKKAANLSLAVTLDNSFTQTVKDYYVVTTATTISGVAFNLNDIVVEYSTDLSTGGLPLSYLVNVTTGLNTGNVSLTNAQLACFRPFTGNFTIPANLVRESSPNVIETSIDNIENDITQINGNQYLVNSEELAFAVKTRDYLDVPNVGDVSFFIGYSSGVRTNGTYDLTRNEWDIARVTKRNGDTFKSFANSNRRRYDLVFDSGTQEFLTYTY